MIIRTVVELGAKWGRTGLLVMARGLDNACLKFSSVDFSAIARPCLSGVGLLRCSLKFINNIPVEVHGLVQGWISVAMLLEVFEG